MARKLKKDYGPLFVANPELKNEVSVRALQAVKTKPGEGIEFTGSLDLLSWGRRAVVACIPRTKDPIDHETLPLSDFAPWALLKPDSKLNAATQDDVRPRLPNVG